MRKIDNIVQDAEKLMHEGKAEQAVEFFLNAIDRYSMISEEMADEAALQLGWLLFEQQFYSESIEVWKQLQDREYCRDRIGRIIREAFIEPNEEEFKAIYEENIEKFAGQIYIQKGCNYSELPYGFLPIAENVYYLYNKSNGQIGERIDIVSKSYPDDEIFKGENTFDSVLFWEEWDYIKPLEIKQRNSGQTVCFLAGNNSPLSYLQLPEFSDLFRESWYIFDDVNVMKGFFHEHRGISLPRKYMGIQGKADEFQEWIVSEHKFRCSKEGRDNKNILLTIGIPSYNRGQRALENICHLQDLPYDSEIEFLVCDNCSDQNIEGYQEIQNLIENDSRVTYYRFPDNPGKNLSYAEAVTRASGKFCCLLSDEDLIYLDSIWKYMYLIRMYGDVVGFISGAGSFFYSDNENGLYEKGELAFEQTFWSLNYMSGLIFKTELYRTLGLYKWQVENRNKNYFVSSYGHNAVAMRCALEENIYICGELLFQEGKEDSFSSGYGDFEGRKILRYTRMDRRIKQLEGIIMLLNEWKDMLSLEMFKNAYMSAVNKVFFLIDLIREQGQKIECGFHEAYDYIFRVSVKGIEKLEMNIEDWEYAKMVKLFFAWRENFIKLCTMEEDI